MDARPFVVVVLLATSWAATAHADDAGDDAGSDAGADAAPDADIDPDFGANTGSPAETLVPPAPTDDSGCAASGGSPALLGAPLAIGLLLARRRRRQCRQGHGP